MNNIINVALVKLLDKTLEDLPVGTHFVDETVTLHIKAEVSRAKDVQYTPTAKVPLKATLALLLSKMGFQRERAGELLVEAMTEALRAEQQGSEVLEALLNNVDEALERVNKITAALPKETRKGATKVTGTVELVENLVTV